MLSKRNQTQKAIHYLISFTKRQRESAVARGSELLITKRQPKGIFWDDVTVLNFDCGDYTCYLFFKTHRTVHCM